MKGAYLMSTNLLFIKPNSTLEKELLTYFNEFSTCLDELHGASSLHEFSDISDWLNHLFLYENRDTMPNKSFVPGHQYVLLRPADNKVLGMLHLRLELNDYLKEIGGHIGYSIAPSERNKGLGTEILAHGLKKASEFQLDKVLVTCDEDNLGSAKIIEHNHGVFDSLIFDEFSKKYIKRYWIDL